MEINETISYFPEAAPSVHRNGHIETADEDVKRNQIVMDMADRYFRLPVGVPVSMITALHAALKFINN